jgi:C4-dicarboxylate-specific signal transduction histidine kinase
VFRRTRSLGVAAAAFLAAILLVLFITRSISGPLKRQADELKTAIQSLREHEFMLEQRVRERTRELRLEIQERKETDAKLQASHRELLEASRRAGMAEIATGILHNVGNVLNSINVSCEIIDARVKKFKIASLGKTADLLGENQENLADFFANDGRGKMIPGFLSQLALHFTDEQANILKEISLLQANVDHVKGIVRTQQASASFKATSEELNLRELVEDAMRLNIMSLNKHDVRVVKEYREIPLVPADKHNVLQILVNLISNAKQAMKDSAEKTLTIGIEALNDGNVRVWVRDTGCGIAPENMTRIFAHGFTTKTDGHGFGLHSAALAAKAMKGSVTVQSDGPGRGSTFSLVLPMLSSQRNAA